MVGCPLEECTLTLNLCKCTAINIHRVKKKNPFTYQWCKRLGHLFKCYKSLNHWQVPWWVCEWLSGWALCAFVIQFICACPVTATFQATTVTARRPSLNWAFETRTRLEVSEYPGQQNCIRSQILSRLRHILGMFICWDEERQRWWTCARAGIIPTFHSTPLDHAIQTNRTDLVLGWGLFLFSLEYVEVSPPNVTL